MKTLEAIKKYILYVTVTGLVSLLFVGALNSIIQTEKAYNECLESERPIEQCLAILN